MPALRGAVPPGAALEGACLWAWSFHPLGTREVCKGSVAHKSGLEANVSITQVVVAKMSLSTCTALFPLKFE